MAGVSVPRRRAAAIAAALLASVALAGCGGSGVKPSGYVKSVCVALGNWRNTIVSATVALEASGASHATPSVAKLDYQRLVSALVVATRRATRSIRAAGTPAVTGGQRIAQRLVRAFEHATSGLHEASTQAAAISTDTATDFQLGLSALNTRIRSAFAPIALVSPGQNRQLRSAAAKEPACRLLAS